MLSCCFYLFSFFIIWPLSNILSSIPLPLFPSLPFPSLPTNQPLHTISIQMYTTGRTYSSLSRSLSDTEQLCQTLSQRCDGYEKESVRVLESLRVGVLFLSHLCIDDFRSDLSSEGGTYVCLPFLRFPFLWFSYPSSLVRWLFSNFFPFISY